MHLRPSLFQRMFTNTFQDNMHRVKYYSTTATNTTTYTDNNINTNIKFVRRQIHLKQNLNIKLCYSIIQLHESTIDRTT